MYHIRHFNGFVVKRKTLTFVKVYRLWGVVDNYHFVVITKLKDLFETCYTPEDVSKWIDDFIKTDVAKPPYNEIISIIYTLQKEDTEPPTVSVIRRELNAQLTSNYSSDKVTEFMKAIENIVPSQFHFDGEYAYVDSSPDILKGHISRAISSEIPLSAREIYNGIFSE